MYHLRLVNSMNNVDLMQLNQTELKELETKIKDSFINRALYKGAAEVVNAVIDRKPITIMYLIGTLDPWYESAITKCLIQTEANIKLVRLNKKYQRLVYDVIKDLVLPSKTISKNLVARSKSRRFFLTRVFAI